MQHCPKTLAKTSEQALFSQLTMQIGLIGLGKMGYNIALNLARHGHTVIAHDQSDVLTVKIAAEPGISSANTLVDLIAALTPRRVIWLMVPAGPIVDELIEGLLPHLSQGDILIDGGNSNFNDSVRSYNYLKTNGIEFLDCGTSGGTTGALNGACTMIGGEEAVYNFCKPIFDDLSLPGGTRYVGGRGGSPVFALFIRGACTTLGRFCPGQFYWSDGTAYPSAFYSCGHGGCAAQPEICGGCFGRKNAHSDDSCQWRFCT